MKSLILASIAAFVFAAPAMAAEGGHCDADITAVKAAAAKAKLSDADAKTVNDALTAAETLHKAGKEEDCEKSLAGAMKLVGVKEQHKD